MDAYTERNYRNGFRQDRWKGIQVEYKETDLWIGIDRKSYHPDIEVYTLDIIRELRDNMDRYLQTDPDYAKALCPYQAKETAPEIFRSMSQISTITGIGPMSAVAGAFARHVALAIRSKFTVKELIVENGGDIYADISSPIDVAVFAGKSVLSQKIGLHITADHSPLGICTSSGTVGPSLSFGKADALMIICKDVLLADSYATAFANLVKEKEDIEPVIEVIRKKEDILGALIVKDDRMGIIGIFELTFFNTK